MNGTTENVWCHTCSRNTIGDYIASSEEYSCQECGSTFVERAGQDIESFLEQQEDPSSIPENPDVSTASPAATPAASSSSQQPSSNGANGPVPGVVQLILDQLIGNTGNSSSENWTEMPGFMPLPGGGMMGQLGGGGAMMFQSMQSNGGNWTVRSGAGLGGGASGMGASSDGNFQDLLHQLFQNAPGQAATPTEAAVMASLTRKKILTEEDKQLGPCPISQDAFEIDEDVIVMACCGSAFGEDSLCVWCSSHNTCPVCRAIITVPSTGEATNDSTGAAGSCDGESSVHAGADTTYVGEASPPDAHPCEHTSVPQEQEDENGPTAASASIIDDDDTDM